MSSPTRLKETAVAKRFRLDALLPDAQNRRLRDWRVEQIAREFDFAKWSPPVVRQNGNGRPTIIEGHHRVVAACKAGLGETEVITYCHPPIEADSRVGEMYLGLNDTLGSTPTERFLMRLRAGDETAIAVAAAIDGAGFVGIAESPTDDMIHSPSACEWVYEGGSFKRQGQTPEALGFTLEAIKKTYGKTRYSVRRDIIRGFGSFAHRYPKQDAKEVARKVRARHPEPNDLISSTQTMADALGCQSNKAMALVIRQDFNYQRRGSKLEEW
jgi:hypothetical protein